MAHYLDDSDFAERCRGLFDRGSRWLDEHLFNGEYYEHHIEPPLRVSDVAASLRLGMGGKILDTPDYQLGPGCLVDQLVGQLLAHVCGLGYLADKRHVRKTLKSIWKYNRCASLKNHFNCMRSYALDDEAALLMASYPGERPRNPFPYFTEVMTGFEYTAAIGMLYEGQESTGLQAIRDIRSRYDGRKRSPFDEAECGHHYARAMVSWAAVLALTGFRYSGVEQQMHFAPREGTAFWSTGYAWGTCKIEQDATNAEIELHVLHGSLPLRRFTLTGYGSHVFPRARNLQPRRAVVFGITPD